MSIRHGADVIEFATLDSAWTHRQPWCRSLQRLDASHLIGADHAFAICDTWHGFAEHGTDVSDPLIALFGRLVGGGCEPIPNQVWFEIGFS